MKNSISHLLAFILMIILSVTIFFVIGEKELRASVITDKLEKDNYYYKIYGTILSRIDDYVVNAEVMDLYKEYLSVDMIKMDIKKSINNAYSEKSSKVSRYNDFYKIINDYSKDSTVSKKYAEGIDKIYSNNLFPTRELSLIHKLYVPSTQVLFMLIVSLLICLVLCFALFLINNNFKFHIISLISTSILLILPNIFIKLFGVFDNFVYTNEYYTDVLISIVNDTMSSSCLVGIVIIIFLITYKFINKKCKF